MTYISNQYHLSVKGVSRGQGRSSVGAAAYRAGEKLHNDYDGLTHDFTKRGGVIYKEIMLPPHAPETFSDREYLWNAAERAEKRVDARTAREVEIALPNELTQQQQIDLVREFVGRTLISQGMCADVAIHHGRHAHRADGEHREATDDNIIKPNNPHAHIMLTARPIDEQGFVAKKDRSWESPKNVYKWRREWADAQNRIFERLGLDVRVDHRSYAERGIEKVPTIHEGHIAREMEARGVHSDKGNANRDIRQINESGVAEMVKNDRTNGVFDLDDFERRNVVYAERRGLLGNVIASYRNPKLVYEEGLNPKLLYPGDKEWARLMEEKHPRTGVDEPAYHQQDMLGFQSPDAYNLLLNIEPTNIKQPERPAMPHASLPHDRTLYENPAAHLLESSGQAPSQSAPVTNADAPEAAISQSLPAAALEPAPVPSLEPSPRETRPESPAARRLLGQVMDLEEISAAMRDFDGKLSDLSSRLHETGVLDKNRDFITQRIGNIQNSRQQALDTLQRDHGIAPSEIAERISQLRTQADREEQSHAAALPIPAVQIPVPVPKTQSLPSPQQGQRAEREQEMGQSRSR